MHEDPVVSLGIELGTVVWVAMVVGGIRIAMRKNRSPHWMWLGLHPLGALIALTAMAVIRPRTGDGRDGWSTWARRGEICGEPYCSAECMESSCPSEIAVGGPR